MKFDSKKMISELVEDHFFTVTYSITAKFCKEYQIQQIFSQSRSDKVIVSSGPEKPYYLKKKGMSLLY